MFAFTHPKLLAPIRYVYRDGGIDDDARHGAGTDLPFIELEEEQEAHGDTLQQCRDEKQKEIYQETQQVWINKQYKRMMSM